MKTLKYAVVVALAICGQSVFASREKANSDIVERVKKHVKTANIHQLQKDRHELATEKMLYLKRIQAIDDTSMEVGSQMCALRSKHMADLKEQLTTHEVEYQRDQADMAKTEKQQVEVIPSPVLSQESRQQMPI